MANDYFCFFGFRFFSICGFALMSALIASSKLNGWSETGLAFGMRPPIYE
jgi:hypothetical protein